MKLLFGLRYRRDWFLQSKEAKTPPPAKGCVERFVGIARLEHYCINVDKNLADQIGRLVEVSATQMLADFGKMTRF